MINKDIRTVIIKLGVVKELESTMSTFNKTCQEIINFGYENHTFNKNKLHKRTYNLLRKKYPRIQSSLLQTSRDQASDMLKKLKLKQKPIKKEFSGIRFDKRNLSIMFDKGIISISTLFGRQKIPFIMANYFKKYSEWKYSNAQLVKKRQNYFLHLQMLNDKIPKVEGFETLDIDSGIKNIVTLSNNSFFNSRSLRNIKGKYQKLKSDLQSKGTKSAKRKLQKVSGKENRFVRNVNHLISKQIVELPFNVFALEDLKNVRNSRTGRKTRKMIGNWSFAQLRSFIEYKVERLGKSVVLVNPKYTSQECSKCGYVDKNNRHESVFKCKECVFELHSDLNASRNIVRGGKSLFVQALVNKPNVVSDEAETGNRIEAELNDKPTISMVGN